MNLDKLIQSTMDIQLILKKIRELVKGACYKNGLQIISIQKCISQHRLF